MADYDLKAITPDTGFTTGNFLFGADDQSSATPVPYTAAGIKTYTSNAPTLVTPVLGVATATSINGLTITSSTGTLTIANGKTLTVSNSGTLAGGDAFVLAIAAGKTLTASNSGTLAGGDAFVLAIAAGKTLTVSNSLTLAGTDSTTMTFPATSGTVATLGLAQTFTATKTFNAANAIVLGAAAGNTGSFNMLGTTSGTVTIKVADDAGTWTMTLPADDGANTNVLQTDGNGVTSWVAAGGSGSLTVGTSAIVSGTAGRLLYEAAGNVLGEPTGVTSNGTGLIVTANGALSSSTGPGLSATGTWITGGSATTTKPYVLIETAGATSTGWSTNGTGLGVNAASGFTGKLADFQLNGSSKASIASTGYPTFGVLVIANPAGNIVDFTVNGTYIFDGDPNNGLKVNEALGISFSSGSGSAPGAIFKGASHVFTFGGNAAASPAAQTLRVQSVVAGTSNTVGANWTLIGSVGTGTGAGGQIILRTAPAGSTGTSQNALATGLTITAPAVDMQPSVVVGNQALATDATDGFLYIPTCAGTPTGTPTTFTGRVAMVFDSSNNKFYIYDGSWLGGTVPGAFV